MARTTAQAFDAFDAAIKLGPADEQKARDRTASVTGMLQSAFPSSVKAPLSDVHRMGSTHRGTAVRPLGDIDLLAVFGNGRNAYEDWRWNSQQFLGYVRGRIDGATTVQKVGARGQAVRLFYSDGLWVDVAPVFAYSGGGYGLPRGDGKWLTIDPLKQNTWATQRNSQLGYRMNPLVRKLKAWNSAHSSRLGSWHLHVMAGTVFRSIGGDSREALDLFFRIAGGRLTVSDPDGRQGDVSSYLTWAARQHVVSSFASAAARTSAALKAEAAGNHAEAKRLWRIVLGPSFPTA